MAEERGRNNLMRQGRKDLIPETPVVGVVHPFFMPDLLGERTYPIPEPDETGEEPKAD